MARTLEFYFDYGSPYSYLADTQVEAIAQRAGAALVRKPMLLGGVFGAPTCFVDTMMFFGNDRLPFVEMALKEELK